MVKDSLKQTREERLAAKLRENLRRRKQQARAKEPVGDSQSSENATLPKEPPTG